MQGGKMQSIIHRAISSVLLVFALLWASMGASQDFPTRPVKIVVPSSAGGGSDTTARLLAQKLSEMYGQQVIVDNRPGAGNVIGTEAVAKSAPDGYTLLMAINNHAINASLYQKLPYDPIKDFAPISLVVTYPHILVVHPSLPARSVRDLVRLARSNPGQINYASSGNGTGAHFAGELFKLSAKIEMAHIPYKGISGAVIDLVAGAVQVMFPNPLTSMSQIRAGKLRALAVTTAKRSQAVPELPTMQESGIANYELSSWIGLLAPRATPNAVVSKLSRTVTQVMQSPDVRARLASEGADPVGSTPEAYASFLGAEVDKYARLVKKIGLRID
jgi:tripartite-type tricarboxylate transporter receptor subunit TctC